MKDYTYYIDFNAIKLGDLATSLGDYKCALENLSKALKKLKSYPGDKLTPAVMAGEISKKIDNIKNRNDNGTPIFKFDYWKLTKTSFVKGYFLLGWMSFDISFISVDFPLPLAPKITQCSFCFIVRFIFSNTGEISYPA